ncbi:MAG: hypothetical protein C4345_09255 [Chloroflexota bacterium]
MHAMGATPGRLPIWLACTDACIRGTGSGILANRGMQSSRELTTMDRHWNAYMHVGIVHFMLWPQVQGGTGPILETAAQLAQDSFFNVLEVTRVEDPETRRKLRELMEAAHVELGFGAQPGLLRNRLNLADLDEDGRRRAVDEVKGAIDQAYELDCRLLAFMDGPQSYPGPEQVGAATDQLVRSIVELCRYASDRGREYELALSLETFDRDVEKKSLIGPTRDAVELARAGLQLRADP